MKFLYFKDEIINCIELKRMQLQQNGIKIEFYLNNIIWWIPHKNESELSKLHYFIMLFLSSKDEHVFDLDDHLNEYFTNIDEE